MRLEQIRKIGIVGAGTMGAGIAFCFAQAGYEVTIFSRSEDGLERGRASVQRSLDLFEREGMIGEETPVLSKAEVAVSIPTLIQYTTDLKTCLDGVQFVLESAPERLELKQTLFQQMESFCAVDSILATNTSGLSITDIASVCQYPERVVGLHWANPAEIVPLVEVVRGEETAVSSIQTTYALAEKLGKMPVVIQKEIPGFASNRLQFALLREALHLVQEGVVSVEDVDRVLKGGVGFRYPWLGALETADLGGLDVFHSIAQYLFAELSSMTSPPDFFSQIVEKGKLGIKTGEGFYPYQEGDKEQILSRRDQYFARQLKLIHEM